MSLARKSFVGRPSRLLIGAVALLSGITWTSSARAEWNVAQSKHFVIYAKESARDLNDFATKLEYFDGAARWAMAMDDPDIGQANRLTVFVLSSPEDVQAALGGKNRNIDGFYTGRVTGSLAYVPRHLDSPVGDPQQVFFHEYAHHLMAQSLERPYPQWYIEGFAEYLSTAKIDKDGSVWFGEPLNARANALLNGPQVHFEALAAGINPKMNVREIDAYYAWAWLLADQLQVSDKRRGQLRAYFDALASGDSGLDAARKAFGDLKQLDHELYLARLQRFMAFKVPASKFRVNPVEVKPLSPGASEVIALRSKLDLSPSQVSDELLPRLRDIESRNVGDEMVETTLAKAELSSRHAEAARAAADRALKTNPKNIEAMIEKGLAIEQGAPKEAGPARRAQFDKAREMFITANKIDTEAPQPLYEFYRSFIRQGLPPTDNAIAALHYASDLAPQDLSVRMASALAYLRVGKSKEARTVLGVVAYSPHENPMNDIAKRMIADIDSGKPFAALTETRIPAQSTSP